MTTATLVRSPGGILYFSATPAIDATPDYSAGDLIGDKIEFPGVGRASDQKAANQNTGGYITSCRITDLADAAVQLDVIFWNEDPSGTTFTDNAAFDVDDADWDKEIDTIELTRANSKADNGVISMGAGVVLPAFVVAAAGTSLWGAIISRGAPNYASTADLNLKVGIDIR